MERTALITVSTMDAGICLNRQFVIMIGRHPIAGHGQIIIFVDQADVGCGWQDTAIAGTYFELLCAAHGLGAILMSFCLDVLKRMPDVWSLLHIPDDRCVSMAIGFGYPMIPYARGGQREDAVRSEVLSFPAVS